jgi:hypothetical protein
MWHIAARQYVATDGIKIAALIYFDFRKVTLGRVVSANSYVI